MSSLARTQSPKYTSLQPNIMGRASPPMSLKFHLEIAKSESYHAILIEGDSKIRMDALNESEESWQWKIDNMCYEAKLLCVSFDSICFLLDR